ncbi:MAG TPA: hypothetical protein VF790_03910, partial [Dissulfurispiraceae bacterium]
MRKAVLFGVMLLAALSGCAHSVEYVAGEEFGLPAPTGICRVDNIRALKGNGIIVSGLYRYGDELFRHVTAYKEKGKVLERLDFTCPQCEPAGLPILVVYVKDYRIVKVEEAVHESLTPQKIAYIRKALAIEEERERS